ncbi:MAG: PorT family protein [Chlorobi bacterium]|nr:PorT family protein [Chlorobiota bacterium]
MKKYFILILLSYLFVFNVSAQSEKGNRFSFLLSPQVSWMKSDHIAVDGNGNVFGFDFGVLYDRFFDKNYAFTTGVVINSTGGKLSYRDTVPANIGGEIVDVTSLDYKLKYLEIPLGLKLLTNDFRRTRYYTEMGLYMAFNIKARDDNGKALSEEVKLFDSGFHVGGGMEYSLGGTTYLMLGIKYSGGFVDITSNDAVDDNVNLQRLEFRFGVVF